MTADTPVKCDLTVSELMEARYLLLHLAPELEDRVKQLQQQPSTEADASTIARAIQCSQKLHEQTLAMIRRLEKTLITMAEEPTE